MEPTTKTKPIGTHDARMKLRDLMLIFKGINASCDLNAVDLYSLGTKIQNVAKQLDPTHHQYVIACMCTFCAINRRNNANKAF